MIEMTAKIGCCTWIFGGAPLGDIAQRVRRSGLDGVELFGDVDGLDPSSARNILNGEGLDIFSITPGDADISHPDAAVRNAGIDYYDRLMDWARALGEPLISCHGQVGRIKPVASQQEEDELLVASVDRICAMARARGLKVVFEILNRYETHQVRTVSEGLALLDAVRADNLRLLPDAYHMNIEEDDPAAALREGAGRIGLYHAADSNRCGIGQGHTDFTAQLSALRGIGYSGPIILETNAPGPNPFSPEKSGGFREIVEAQLSASGTELRKLAA
ncbi:sugar phosphate isomerase/epimerase [Roseibium sp. MMSF_3412]|uniref:sugar phosphate isomerase/epimerase family protein n=1 Tax=Roseibium sp. MMSF_3412 TaxID=3046712 RepID=UPI00273DA562|nr:sugar phosphate isomerase/epimerase family protein [Roseibium sp. MMSF_3412]